MTAEPIAAVLLNLNASGQVTLEVKSSDLKTLGGSVGDVVQLIPVAQPERASEPQREEQGDFAPEPPPEMMASYEEPRDEDFQTIFNNLAELGYQNKSLADLIVSTLGTMKPINRMTYDERQQLYRAAKEKGRPVGETRKAQPSDKLTNDEASRLHKKLGAIGFAKEQHYRMASDKLRRSVTSFTELTRAESITLVDFAERQIKQERE